MATLNSGATSGAGGTLRWTWTGPAWLADSSAFGTGYRRNLSAALPALARAFKSDASAAYAGTRFAATFTTETTFSPTARVDLIQRHPLFPVVEYPTRPHAIVPRSATVLHWVSGGQGVFARHVAHPGTKGRGAMAPLLDKYAPRFRAVLTEAVLAAVTAP